MPRFLLRLALLGLIGVSAGCDNDDGTEPSMRAGPAKMRAGTGEVAAENGTVEVALGEGALPIGPQLRVGADGAGGIPLQRGSQIDGMRVTTGDTNAKTKPAVAIRWHSVDPPAAVLDYYAQAAADVGYQVRREGAMLEGAKADGSRVSVEATARGAGSAGTITIAGGLAADVAPR